MFDCQGQHPYGLSFQPQRDGCDVAATLENSLVQLNFKNMSQKLSFNGLILIRIAPMSIPEQS